MTSLNEEKTPGDSSSYRKDVFAFTMISNRKGSSSILLKDPVAFLVRILHPLQAICQHGFLTFFKILQKIQKDSKM